MNYYNEFDPKAAAWLRELIKRNLIPAGEVDERSIADVRADDLRGFTQCHFFAGIGGWSLALRLAGWPEDKPVWTGSCPCQSFSSAGKYKGAEDDRDLWPVFFNLIKACRPEYVFGEQVEAAIKHGWLDRVCANMEAEGYTIGACVLGAHSAGAPHQRQRLYWGARALADERDPRFNHESILWQGRTETFWSGPAVGMAQNSAILGRGGRDNGDSAGDDGEIQAAEFGHGERMSDCNNVGHLHEQPQKHTGDTNVEPFANATASGRAGDFDMAHADLPRRGECGRGEPVFSECATTKLDSIYGLSPWSDFAVINCTDGKTRRIPSQPIFQRMADGLSEGVDGGGESSVFAHPEEGFPLAQKIEGQNMLLKGYGNAIVPQCAAAFVAEFIN